MIEDKTLILFYIIIGMPTLIGLIYCILTRPRNYYYKLTARGWEKIRFRAKR